MLSTSPAVNTPSKGRPTDRKASAMPPMPINRPPIPTHLKPVAGPFAKNGPKKMTRPATLWNSGTTIFLSDSIPPKLVIAIARKPRAANHLKTFFQVGKYCSAMPIEIPSGIRLATVRTKGVPRMPYPRKMSKTPLTNSTAKPMM